MTCVNGPPASAAHCDSSDLTNANLTHANLSGAVLSAQTPLHRALISLYGLATGSANLSGADLRELIFPQGTAALNLRRRQPRWR